MSEATGFLFMSVWIFLIWILPFGIVPLVSKSNEINRFNVYINALRQNGFNVQREFLVHAKTKWYHGWWNCHPILGLLVDYDKKWFAIRTDRMQTEPIIYSFAALQSFQMSEDILSQSKGMAIGYGMLAVGGGKGKAMAGLLTIDIALRGNYGAENMTLYAYRKNSSSVSTQSKTYRDILSEMQQVAVNLQWIHDNKN